MRRLQDRDEAEDMLKEAAHMNYETMFMKGSKEPVDAKKTKDGQPAGEKKQKAKEKKEAIINRLKIIRCKSCNASPTRVSK